MTRAFNRDEHFYQSDAFKEIISGLETEGMHQLGNAVPVKLGYILGSGLQIQLPF